MSGKSLAGQIFVKKANKKVSVQKKGQKSNKKRPKKESFVETKQFASRSSCPGLNHLVTTRNDPKKMAQ